MAALWVNAEGGGTRSWRYSNVEIKFEPEPREVPVPPLFAQALGNERIAKAALKSQRLHARKKYSDISAN